MKVESEGKLLYQCGAVEVDVGIEDGGRRAPVLGAPLLYQVKMI